MKIECHCGQLLVDPSDDLSGKAHLIPDQDWLALMDDLDEKVVDGVREGQLNPEGAYMALRTLLSKASRPDWQCSGFGRLYLDGAGGKTVCFRPEGETPDHGALCRHS
ncbi:MAG: hypothetical protein P1V35_16055 [Planctomycetota bacterium]|nr:hypothetical protein [Planctomycetota bacterium]